MHPTALGGAGAGLEGRRERAGRRALVTAAERGFGAGRRLGLAPGREAFRAPGFRALTCDRLEREAVFRLLTRLRFLAAMGPS